MTACVWVFWIGVREKRNVVNTCESQFYMLKCGSGACKSHGLISLINVPANDMISLH